MRFEEVSVGYPARVAAPRARARRAAGDPARRRSRRPRPVHRLGGRAARPVGPLVTAVDPALADVLPRPWWSPRRPPTTTRTPCSPPRRSRRWRRPSRRGARSSPPRGRAPATRSRRLGLPAPAVPVGEKRAPVWPDGVVGAITHCAGFRAAAVAWRDAGPHGRPRRRAPHGPARRRARGGVGRRGARACSTASPASSPTCAWDKILFSAKESVYKAWFPLTGRWLGFEDAELAPAAGRHLPRRAARARSGGRRRRDHRVRRALGGARRPGDHGDRAAGGAGSRKLVPRCGTRPSGSATSRSWSSASARRRTRARSRTSAGAGRPLRGLNGPHDENWWLRSYLEREGLPNDVLLPTPLRLRREIDRLPETVRDMDTEREVRDAVAALARRVAEWLRFPDGPQISVRMPRADEVVAGWRAERAARVVAPGPGPGGAGRVDGVAERARSGRPDVRTSRSRPSAWARRPGASPSTRSRPADVTGSACARGPGEVEDRARRRGRVSSAARTSSGPERSGRGALAGPAGRARAARPSPRRCRGSARACR